MADGRIPVVKRGDAACVILAPDTAMPAQGHLYVPTYLDSEFRMPAEERIRTRNEVHTR